MYRASVRSGPHHSASAADASAKLHYSLITFYTWNEDTKFKVIRFFMMLHQGGQVRSITCGRYLKTVLTGVLFHCSCTLVSGEIPAKTGNKVNAPVKIPSVNKAQIWFYFSISSAQPTQNQCGGNLEQKSCPRRGRLWHCHPSLKTSEASNHTYAMIERKEKQN